MNTKDKATALDVNAFLMALHQEDSKVMETIITESENPYDLLFGGVMQLKAMTDMLIDTVDELSDESDITYEALIQVTAEYLLGQPDES